LELKIAKKSVHYNLLGNIFLKSEQSMLLERRRS